MTALTNNLLLAMEISQTTLIVLMAVLIVLIILLAVLATIFILGVGRRNRKSQPESVLVFADLDIAQGTITLKDENDTEKSIFKPNDTVKVAVKANEGFIISNISVLVNDNVLARFKVDKEKMLSDGVYEFVITTNTTVKAEFQAVECAPVEEIISFTEFFNGVGGVVTLTDDLGQEKSQFVKGEKVRIAVVADEGYYVARFAVDDEEQELVEGVYEFIAEKPVKISVEFLPIKCNVTVEVGDNGAVTATNADGVEQAEFNYGETVKVSAVANENCQLISLSVNGEEKDVAQTYEFVIKTHLNIKAQFEIIPQVVTEIAAADSEDEEDDEVMFDGHNVIRFNKSFTAKLIQIDEVSNAWYTELKNELLSYKKVKERMSWKRETYRIGRECVARFVIRGKTLCIQLPLDPTQFEETKYKVEDISNIMSSADTPCLYRIKNERRLNYAKDLIAQVMESMGAVRIEREWEDYFQPYDTTANLIERQLVKKVIKFNGKTGYGGIVEKLTEDPTKVQNADETSEKK